MDVENASSQFEMRVNVQLRNARMGKFWTVREAAQRARVSETTYIRWEQGRQVPHLSTLGPLCDAFGVSASELGFKGVVTKRKVDQRLSRAEQLKIKSSQDELSQASTQLRDLAKEVHSYRETQTMLNTQLVLAQQARQIAQVQLNDALSEIAQLKRKLKAERLTKLKLLAEAEVNPLPLE